MAPIASRIGYLLNQLSPLISFLTQGDWVRHADDPNAANFVLGTPHEMPLTRFVDALQQHSIPQNKNWFAYKLSEPGSQQVIGAALRARFNLPFRDEDIHMTNGAFAGLSVALTAVVDPGDEVIFISPPWFFYEALIVGTGATPVRVKVNPETFDLDVDAIAAAITPKTRAIIVNSPNNPTGRIYPEATLKQLAQVLEAASARSGRTIHLISDEAYSRIVYDGKTFITPTTYYANSFLIYTYGKVLLTPGQRVGYIALAPNMENREMMSGAVLMAQILTGYAFPNALLQHALADLENTSIDIAHLQAKRDLIVGSLGESGYDVHVPEGTFYLMPRSPLADDAQFTDLLAAQNVYTLPGWVFEMPGYFRISLTANDAMVERSLAGFAEARRQAAVLA
jgi:aspartate aminotransferase